MLEQQTEVPPESETGDFTSVKALKSILQRIEQGIVLMDERRNLLFANKRARRILAAETEDDVAKVLERNCPDRIFEKIKEKQGTTTFIDITLPDQDKRNLVGLEIYYIGTLLAAPCYLVLMHDFSKWRKLDELHSRFATYLSHRMRTPLTAVRNAVKILNEEAETLSQSKEEKLLDIGWRNTEKLISSLDELQKIFMIESEEMNVCRTLIMVNREMKPLFGELVREGRIRGFKLRMPELAILAGRGRLRDFITTAVDAYWKWIGEAPFIECNSSIREDFRGFGGCGRKIKISMRPRFSGRCEVERGRLKDFLFYHEAHRGLILNRIATALDGEIDIDSKDKISLFLPINPPFNREKDLVYPIHMMMERAELTGGEFHIAALKMVGVANC
ncbi:MAG: hypothetical protein KAX38_08225, partial [Candidatus Krumholzibacteria bacterium]|nr:hypothetical protein [Candidatus Krumholzibacteria bacterium]